MITQRTRRAAGTTLPPLWGLKHWWDGKVIESNGHWIDKIGGVEIGTSANTATYGDKGLLTGQVATNKVSFTNSHKATYEITVKLPATLVSGVSYEGAFRISYFSNPGTGRWAFCIKNGGYYFWSNITGDKAFSSSLQYLVTGARNVFTLTFDNATVTLFVNGNKIATITATNWVLPTNQEASSNNLSAMIRNEGDRYAEINSGKMWERILTDEEIALSAQQTLDYYADSPTPTPIPGADPNYVKITQICYTAVAPASAYEEVEIDSNGELFGQITNSVGFYSGNTAQFMLFDAEFGTSIQSVASNLTATVIDYHLPSGASFSEEVTVGWDSNENNIYVELGQISYPSTIGQSAYFYVELSSNGVYIGEIQLTISNFL